MDKSQPFISVIIPTYNREKYIKSTVDSVLAQTYKNYEIIVVDDGSKDSTKQILNQYGDKIRYIYQVNAGVHTARNVGIKASKGDWIAFLDDDNIWLADKLQKQVDCINRTSVEVCYTNFEIFNEERRWPAYQDKDGKIEKVITEPYAIFLYGAPPLSISTLLAKKSLFEKTGYFDETCEFDDDTRMMLELGRLSPIGFVCSVEMLNNRRTDRQGMVNYSLDSVRKRCSDQIFLLSGTYYRDDTKSKEVIASISHRLSYALCRRAQIACFDKQYRQARHFAKEAFHFANDTRTHLNSLLVLLCPRLVGMICRKRWKN
jgi:glycosyltransferase involved in cell wall biosynthesis